MKYNFPEISFTCFGDSLDKHLAEIQSVLFVSDDFPEIDYIFVIQLSQNFDFSDGGYGEALFLILQADFFQRHVHRSPSVLGLVNLPISTLANLFKDLEDFHASLAPVPATDHRRLATPRASSLNNSWPFELGFGLDSLRDWLWRSCVGILFAAPFVRSGNDCGRGEVVKAEN